MLPPLVTGPIPAYNNPPIEPQFYQPRRFEISDVTLGKTTIVTTVDDLDYVVGQVVRLLIPKPFGCVQLNEKQGIAISFPAANEVEVEIDSSINVDTFTTSSSKNRPQIVAIGDVNNGAINTHGRTQQITYIPGSFINISPA